MNRRSFLKAGVAAGAIAALPWPALASDFWSRPRSLWLWRGKEQVRTTYFADGKIVAAGYTHCCYMLRDVQAGITVQQSLVLLDVLCGMQGWFSSQGVLVPQIILSGYRSPRTNARTEGAARNSQHLSARAADLRMPGVRTDYLARLGLYLRGGGVGYYPSSQFVHVDVGGVRYWRG